MKHIYTLINDEIKSRNEKKKRLLFFKKLTVNNNVSQKISMSLIDYLSRFEF